MHSMKNATVACGSLCCRALNYGSTSAEFAAHARVAHNSKMGPTLERSLGRGEGKKPSWWCRLLVVTGAVHQQRAPPDLPCC